MGQRGGNVCTDCREWWPHPLSKKPLVGICRRDMDYDFANMAGRVHRTEALNVGTNFVARDAQEAPGQQGGFADPALVIHATGDCAR